ncbi:MAG: hypothetical protein HYY59_00230 [Candidatus Omnitrophica bacterium]|nr:hypothetical protein [Candidatus Omnitrophota bacterium]
MDVAYSKDGVPIRLTSDRWLHIVEHHDDLAGYRDSVLEVVEEPEAIARGRTGERLAMKFMEGRTLVVVYRETSRTDGFVITAFFTTQPDRIRKRGLVWPKR